MSLTRSQYDEIMRGYEERHLANAELQRQRRREIEEKLPEYFSYDKKISAAGMEYFKSQMSGSKKMSRDELHKTISSYEEKKRELLTGAGYPVDYLDFIYDCPDCKDTGYIDNEPCHCFKQASVDLLYPSTRLALDFQNASFENFSFDYYDPKLIDDVSKVSSLEYAKNAFEYCQSFVKNFSSTGGNILLYGETGLGKTFLSNCIGNAILKQGYSVLYVTAPQFIDIFERKMKDRSEEYRRDFDLLHDVDLLIIDDLGTEFQNSFSVTNVLECVNDRILYKKSTVISSNLNLKRLQEVYTERFSSRIVEHYKILRLTGKDIRAQK